MYEDEKVRFTAVLEAGIAAVMLVCPAGPFPPGDCVTPGTCASAGLTAPTHMRLSANAKALLFIAMFGLECSFFRCIVRQVIHWGGMKFQTSHNGLSIFFSNRSK